MERQPLSGRLAASAAPLSRALRVGRTVYVSGTLGVDDDGGLANGIEAQTRRALEHIGALLEEAGARMDNVVSTRVYLARREDFAAMNDVYASVFSPPHPTRTTVVVTHVHPDCLVEIEAVALLSDA
jgi:2-iminobutanoate/2-iminopropanoate deaminase